MNPKANREKLTQIMFETFNTPAFYLALRPSLALYASGKTTGLAVQMGASSTWATPIYEGYPIRHATIRRDLCGDVLTIHLIKLLSERGYDDFGVTGERLKEIIRDVKEKKGYVALDFHEEMKISEGSSKVETDYDVSKGFTIVSGNERFRTPEILFDANWLSENPEMVPTNPPADWANWKNNPPASELVNNIFQDKEKKSLLAKLPKELIAGLGRYYLSQGSNGNKMSLHGMVDASIRKCDSDLQKDMWEQIVLCGGSSMVSPPFPHRPPPLNPNNRSNFRFSHHFCSSLDFLRGYKRKLFNWHLQHRK
jgi:actin-related protein